MDGRQKERLRVAAHAARSLRRLKFRTCLEVRDVDGGRPIFPALQDDKASWVFDQVKLLGGDANVVVWDELEPGVKVLAVVVITDEAHEDADQLPIHPDAEFGFLLDALKKCSGPVQCHVITPDTVAHLITT